MTPEDIASMRARHDYLKPEEGPLYCPCGAPIPCDTTRALDALEDADTAAHQLLDERDAALAALDRVRELIPYWEPQPIAGEEILAAIEGTDRDA